MQYARLRYGRVSRCEIHEDSPRFSRLCARLGERGVAEAVAPPI